MEPPDVVLLDINLGVENGLDLLVWMRRETSLNSIPVIAVTAHALVTEQERILKAGCVACLSKPIDFRELREQLQLWLEFRAASRQPSR
jgi:CheY-like chemotaxis protein